jgi:hypothetical protein
MEIIVPTTNAEYQEAIYHCLRKIVSLPYLQNKKAGASIAKFCISVPDLKPNGVVLQMFETPSKTLEAFSFVLDAISQLPNHYINGEFNLEKRTWSCGDSKEFVDMCIKLFQHFKGIIKPGYSDFDPLDNLKKRVCALEI